MQLVLQDRLLSAAEALDWGLVAEVVPDDQVLARAEQLARFIADNAPDARGQAKRLVRATYGRSFAETLEDEGRTIGRALAGSEAPALISGFIGG
jgi:2-(1,2-epoxy-1,2-dihydrophenyl)acetyl-CoA isomerase